MQLRSNLSHIVVLASLMFLAGCVSITVWDSSPAPPDYALSSLNWLEGSWSGHDGKGVSMEEHWTSARGGTMFGINRTMSEDQTTYFEFLRIALDEQGRITYYASPAGRDPATPFTLVDFSARWATFGNDEHDFPTRIHYELQPDKSLMITISGEEDGERTSRRWRLEPQ